MSKKLEVYCDGGARGNPGMAAIGVVIKDNKGGILVSFGKKIGIATNNTAEYQAVLHALKYFMKYKTVCEHIIFFLDSQVVARQLSGIYKTKQPHLKILLQEARLLEKHINSRVEYQSVSRSQNQEADLLVNQALDNEK